MACINVVLADSDEEAHFLASSFYQMALGIIRRKSYPLRKPVASMDQLWSAQEASAIQSMMAYSFVGTPAFVKPQLEKFIKRAKVDELLVTTNIFSHTKRLRSYRLMAEVIRELSATSTLPLH